MSLRNHWRCPCFLWKGGIIPPNKMLSLRISLETLLVAIGSGLIGVFIGHRFSLGRDKRREYSQAILPIRKRIIEQLETLGSGHFDAGIQNADIVDIKASLATAKAKKVAVIYEKYAQYRSKSGSHDKYHNFTKDDEFFDKFINVTKVLLKELSLK